MKSADLCLVDGDAVKHVACGTIDLDDDDDGAVAGSGEALATAESLAAAEVKRRRTSVATFEPPPRDVATVLGAASVAGLVPEDHTRHAHKARKTPTPAVDDTLETRLAALPLEVGRSPKGDDAKSWMAPRPAGQPTSSGRIQCIVDMNKYPNFFIYGHCEGGKRTISWQVHGSAAAAWEVAKKQVGFV